MTATCVLVTGGGGFIGRKVVAALAGEESVDQVVCTDIRLPASADRVRDVIYAEADVRDAGLRDLLAQHNITSVVHLASIVNPGKDSDRAFEYSVDVEGTRNVVEACLATGVQQLVVTSSGAAYGYWPDNPDWIDETDPIRGNESFAYSHHKRLVEEMLAEYRASHPELGQLILRPGTVLGAGLRNQITNLFFKPFVLGVAGSPAPFVFIWDDDVAAIIVKGVVEARQGVYNLAGDGALPMREIARRLGKPYLPLPAWLLRGALTVLKPVGLSRYGPEQVDFLRYRPVLSNRRLKEEFGYTPRKTSAEAFESFMQDADLG